MAFEDHLIFFPTKYPDGFWGINGDALREGVVVEDCFFQTEDGLTLHGWHAARGRARAGLVLLWFHGNAGNLSYRFDMMMRLLELPVSIFIIDYRGYGRSEGRPSEKGIYMDARAAWDYLIRERGLLANQIVIFGKSLGGAAAIDLATRVGAAGLIVQSSFTSTKDMAARLLPFLPARLLRTKMDSISKIGRVTCPKLFIHSRADEIVPFDLGWRLFEAASEPKRFYEVVGAPHNSTYIVGGRGYIDALGRFLESISAR
jgi:fermentation-respiration switch protein FrsA (DUF1100 family)